ncbi:MAG TPA: TonB-dependent receptor [Longimicrobiales bacterium]|nr:TonB-dependent receptor [Longimicrobiales bacterium]
MRTARARLAAVTFGTVFFLATPAASQEPPPPQRTGTGILTGIVASGDVGAPLASVTVELHSATDSVQLARTVTNAEGRFRFEGLPEDRYFLVLSTIGYGGVTTEDFELASEEIRNLGTLRMPLDAVALEPIEVSGERNAVTQEADRTSYNVGVMPGTEGASVTETLQMLPELEIDIDGRITVQGSAPVIYINGRPAPMRGEALSVFLEQFPADYLQRIEVLDNPSARYGAAGSGGIINLVMKEGVELGVSGNVFANAGTRGQYGLGGRVTAQRGDWTVNGGSFLRLNDVERSSFDLRQNLVAQPPFLQQDTHTDRSGLSGNVDLQTRYEPNDRVRVFAEGRLSRSGNDSHSLTTTTHMDDVESPFLVYDRASESDSRNVSADVSTGFDYRWERRVHELNFEVSLQNGRQRGDSRREITTELVDDDVALLPSELTLEEESERDREVSLRLDYTRPLFADVRAEIGVRSERESSDADRIIRLIDDPLNDPYGTALDRGFDQTSVTNAIYGTLRRQFGQLSMQLGLRAEHVDREFEVPGGETFRREYTNFFPSANLSMRLGDGRQVRLSYSRRVGLPGASVLNPTDLSTDPMNRRVGNPDIEARYTHSLSMNASWSGSAGNLRFAPFYRATTNDWTRITTVDDEGVSTRTYQNLAGQSQYGASLTYSLRQRGGWGGNVSVTGRRDVRDASNLSSRYSGDSFRWSSRVNLSAQVTGDLSAQGNFSYSPPTDLPQGRTDASYRSDLGFRYRLLGNRASLRLSLQDPFGLRSTTSRTQDLTYIQLGRSQETTRSAQINLSYALGGGGRVRGGGGGGRGR